MNKLYIYLANRNKNGVKILTILSCKDNFNPTKIIDVSKLGLEDIELENKINKYFYDNRMYWDLFLETAISFKELKKSLKNRGYKDLPSFGGVMFNEQADVVVNKLINKPKLAIKSSKDLNQKTMIRKNKN